MYKIVSYKVKRKRIAKILIALLLIFSLLVFFSRSYLAIFKDKIIELVKENTFIEETENIPDSEIIVENLPFNICPEEVYIEAFDSSKGRYYYELLSNDEKIIYAEYYYILTRMIDNVKINTLDKLTINKIFQYIMNDYPEIFYVEGYNCNFVEYNDEIVTLISGIYSMTYESVLEFSKSINKYCEDFFLALNTDIPNYSDTDLIIYLYNYLIHSTNYSSQSLYNQSIVSVMILHTSVCQGYSKAFQYILQKCNIPCTLVYGTLNNGENHAWNIVKLDDGWYNVDVTWGDASLSYIDKNIQNYVYESDYDYCLVTTDEILKSRILKADQIIPECTSKKNYYYNLINSYFENVDQDKLFKLFNSDSVFIVIKASDEIVYQELYDYLITKKNARFLCPNMVPEFIESPETNRLFFKIK